jgi:hypothetical protein
VHLCVRPGTMLWNGIHGISAIAISTVATSASIEIDHPLGESLRKHSRDNQNQSIPRCRFSCVPTRE